MPERPKPSRARKFIIRTVAAATVSCGVAACGTEAFLTNLGNIPDFTLGVRQGNTENVLAGRGIPGVYCLVSAKNTPGKVVADVTCINSNAAIIRKHKEFINTDNLDNLIES